MAIHENDTPTAPARRIEDYPIAELPDQIALLTNCAEALVRDGRLEEAEQVYHRILEAAPHHLPALTFLAMRAYETGNLEESLLRLQNAIRINPKSAQLQENLAMVRHRQRLPENALDAIDRAIQLAPERAVAHLHRGMILEDLGRERDALLCFGKALKLEPVLRTSPASQPFGIQKLAAHAIGRLAPLRLAAIDQAAQEIEDLFASKLPDRAREFLDIFKGLKAPAYEDAQQHPDFLFYPGLGPKPWFERGEFPWIKAFEAETPGILAEYRSLVSESQSSTPEQPYVAEGARESRIWKELAGSLAWSSFHLYRSGNPAPSVIQRCPRTFSALKHLPLARGQSHAPEVFFSILKPGTRLPPHHGLSNAKLTIHLGLVIPDRCGMKVGGETRQWREGRALIFDDSFRHEAWNAHATPRAVLIADIWNPALAPIEQELVARAIDAHEAFSREYFS